MTTTTPRPTPTAPGKLLSTPPEPTFAPSAELAGHLNELHRKQEAIERRKAEELARLRAIQDRD